MSVRASNRRERIRRPNGDRVELPGGFPSTGLSAFAAAMTEAQTLSGAGRAATFHDAMTPHAEAVILFESLKGTDAVAFTHLMPPGVTLAYGDVSLGIGDRRDNSAWAVALADVAITDSSFSQAGLSPDASQAEFRAESAPAIWHHAVPLDRAVLNTEANPAGVAWQLTQAPDRTNLFPIPTVESMTVPYLWDGGGSGTLTSVSGGAFSGSRFLRMLSAGATSWVQSHPFMVIGPGETVTAQARLKGTAATAGVWLYPEAGGGPTAVGAQIGLTSSWQRAQVTYTHPADAKPAPLILRVHAGAAAAGQVVDFDAILVEAGPDAGPYFDPTYGPGNPLPNPGYNVDTTGWAGMSATLMHDTAGGMRDGPCAWAVATAVPYGIVSTATPIPAPAGTPFSASVRVQVSRPGITGQIRMSFTGAAAVSAPPTVITALGGSPDWQLLTITGVVPAGGTALRPDIIINAGGGAVAGDGIAIDDWTLNVGSTGLFPYVDTATWSNGADSSLTYAYAAGPAGAYSRPVDVLAPWDLPLPGDVWVHRRTGALIPGQRLSSPWAPCSYSMLSGRTFTVAAWVATRPITGVMPSFRWVMELAREVPNAGWLGTSVVIAASTPFSASDLYQRCTALLEPVINDFPDGAGVPRAATHVRLHLECVSGGSMGAATQVSVRGAHLYAGSDRGDRAGLSAVVLPERAQWSVELGAGDVGFKATRVDVHGNDRVSHVTSAASVVTYSDGSPAQTMTGASEGRITMRVPDPERAGLFDSVTVLPEEISGGPGSNLSLQMIRVWHEVDLSPDIATFEVDRSTESDPADSSVPIGNYSGAALSLTLDDAGGEYELFGRQYIDLGHRIETAAGVVYTNRCDDPTGLDAAAAHTPTLTWPTALYEESPVVEVTEDQHGQMPPAPYCGHATGNMTTDSPQRVTAPSAPGWSMRGQVWVRYVGQAPPLGAFGPSLRFDQPTIGITVAMDPSTVDVDLSHLKPDTWTLVILPEITVPLGDVPYGNNSVAFTIRNDQPGDDVWVEIAAPVFERLDPVTGDVIEVVETAPAGIYYSTSWEGATGRGEVQVEAVDVLVSTGDQPYEQTVVLSTSSERELHNIARRYLDLGSDQVRIVDTYSTGITYCLPAEKVSTQIADLAKAAVLTAFTDGMGRFVALLRQDVEPDLAAEYLDVRNLEEAHTAISPDAIRNVVTVTAHPISRKLNAVVGIAGNTDPTDMSVAEWELTGQEFYVPPGAGSTLTVFVPWDFDAAVGTPVLVDAVGVFDYQVGVANPYNVFAATGSFPMPAGANWAAGPGPWLEEGVGVSVTMTPTQGIITFVNRSIPGGPGAFPTSLTPGLWIDHLKIRATGLTIKDVSIREERVESIDAYGRRESEVDVRLATRTTILPPIAADVLDNYSLRDPSGERWLPDLEATALGDPWRELGDRVLVNDVASGVSGEYRVMSHRLAVGIGSKSELYLRRVPTGLVFAVADVHLADDGKVTTY